jgi:6-phosphogluconolactonase/glucosamine-6-phosphate isomerase/deaminase
MNTSHVFVAQTAAALANEAASRFRNAVRDAVARSGRALVCLSGGETPKAAYALLASAPCRD